MKPKTKAGTSQAYQPSVPFAVLFALASFAVNMLAFWITASHYWLSNEASMRNELLTIAITFTPAILLVLSCLFSLAAVGSIINYKEAEKKYYRFGITLFIVNILGAAFLLTILVLPHVNDTFWGVFWFLFKQQFIVIKEFVFDAIFD